MDKRIAIPMIGEMLNEHFGRAQIFEVFEITDGRLQGEKVINIKGFEHQAQGIATLLKQHGIDTVICGGIGQAAIDGLEQAGLEVLRGANGKATDVARAYADGSFVGTTAVCNQAQKHSYRDFECFCDQH